MTCAGAPRVLCLPPLSVSTAPPNICRRRCSNQFRAYFIVCVLLCRRRCVRCCLVSHVPLHVCNVQGASASLVPAGLWNAACATCAGQGVVRGCPSELIHAYGAEPCIAHQRALLQQTLTSRHALGKAGPSPPRCTCTCPFASASASTATSL